MGKMKMFRGKTLCLAALIAVIPQLTFAATVQKMVDVRLHENGAMYGRVVNQQGQPVAAGKVVLQQAQGVVATTQTNADGWFRVTGLKGEAASGMCCRGEPNSGSCRVTHG